METIPTKTTPIAEGKTEYKRYYPIFNKDNGDYSNQIVEFDTLNITNQYFTLLNNNVVVFSSPNLDRLNHVDSLTLECAKKRTTFHLEQNLAFKKQNVNYLSEKVDKLRKEFQNACSEQETNSMDIHIIQKALLS